jgi:hypothetical protein
MTRRLRSFSNIDAQSELPNPLVYSLMNTLRRKSSTVSGAIDVTEFSFANIMISCHLMPEWHCVAPRSRE